MYPHFLMCVLMCVLLYTLFKNSFPCDHSIAMNSKQSSHLKSGSWNSSRSRSRFLYAFPKLHNEYKFINTFHFSKVFGLNLWFTSLAHINENSVFWFFALDILLMFTSDIKPMLQFFLASRPEAQGLSLSLTRRRTCVSRTGRQILYHWATGEAHIHIYTHANNCS